MVTRAEHAKAVMDLADSLKQDRENHDTVRDEIQEALFPYMGDILTRDFVEGLARSNPVMDSTAAESFHRFVNTLKTMIFPQGSMFFMARVPEQVGDAPEAERLLWSASVKVYEGLYDSNFFLASGDSLLPMIMFGNNCLWVEPRGPVDRGGRDRFSGFDFEDVHVADFWIRKGKGDRIMVLRRDYELPAIDLLNLFSGRPGADVRPIQALVEQARGDWLKKVRVRQVIQPNPSNLPMNRYLVFPQNRDAEFISDWVLDEKPGAHLFQGRYQFMPGQVGTWWSVARENYGRGLGHFLRPHAKGLNYLLARLQLALGLEIDKPWLVDSQAKMPRQLHPRVFIRHKMGHLEPRPVETNTNFEAGFAMGEQDRTTIRKATFEDVLGEPEAQTRSAAAERARQDRAIRTLGQPGERVENWLQGVLNVCFETQYRQGGLPELDEYAEITGLDTFDLFLTSPFFTSLRSGPAREFQAYTRELLFRTQATGDPSHVLRVDWDRTYRNERKAFSFDPSNFLSDEEFNQVKEVLAEQQARAQAAQLQAGRAPESGIPGATVPADALS